jgi:hypothetical protein
MAKHVFPFLIGVLLSALWSAFLGAIEVFDSDMLLASGYFAFAGLLMMKKKEVKIMSRMQNLKLEAII